MSRNDIERNICLNCELPDCFESSPGCQFFDEDKYKSQREYYLSHKNAPGYKEKRSQWKRNYYATPKGNANIKAQIARYESKYPERVKEIRRKSYDKYKEKRLEEHKIYMRKKRAELRRKNLNENGLIIETRSSKG